MSKLNYCKDKYEGKLFPTKQNGTLEIMEYVSAKEDNGNSLVRVV